jgi:dolichol-phosphate mannosyltransferase
MQPSTQPLPLSVVIPVYNEPDNIGPTLEALTRQIPIPHELIVVYDHDEDTTLPKLRALLNTYPQLRVVKNAVARGPSGALREGFRQAVGDRILVVMADQCDDFSQIAELIDLVPRHAAIACPSRYCVGGAQELSGLKVWAPRTAGLLLKLLSGLETRDPTNSFKMYSGAMLRQIRLTSTVSFSVTLEIVAKAHGLGFPIVEIPTVWRDRSYGKTNFNLYRSLGAYMPWFLLAILGMRFLPLRRSWRCRMFAAELGRTPTSSTR